LLELLLHLDIAFASDEEVARATYAAARPNNSGAPNFDALIEDHRFRVIWGRISAPFEFSRADQAAADAMLTALQAMLKGRFEETYRVADTARSQAELALVAASIERGEISPQAIGCQAPEWVAARLWDRAPRDSSDKTAALRLWVDRWHLLSSPALIPALVWSDTDFVAFWEAAVEVLESRAGLVNWDEMRAGFIARMAMVSGVSPSNLGAYLPAIPGTLVDRVLWLENNRLKRAVMDTLLACKSISGIVGLLLNGIEAADHAEAPHPFAAKLLALAADRPDLFLIILFRLRVSPKLLADVLLNPPTSALACLIIGQWQPLAQLPAWATDFSARRPHKDS